MSDLERFVEILRLANGPQPNKVACDSEIRAEVAKLVLEPLMGKLAVEGWPAWELAPEKCPNARPQYIRDARIATPRETLLPQFGIALQDAGVGPWLGVTVVQRDQRHDDTYPAHIRWGVWTHTPAAKERILGPFRMVSRALTWDIAERTIDRPVVAMARGFWLTMLGGLLEAERVEQRASLEALIDEIGAELFVLSRAVQRQ